MGTESEVNTLDTVMELINEHGFEGMSQAISVLINEAMKVERARVLNALPYERTKERKGYANGFKPRRVKSRLGELDLQSPQVRGDDVEFYPSALERGERSERALKAAMAAMYIQGVSTRRVTSVMKELCGTDFTASDVSRATARLDEELTKWRNRPLGHIEYLIIDARYEKVRVDGTVVSAAVLVACGVLKNGRRTVLGVSVSTNEAEVHWRAFLQSLVERGMHGVKMVTSDDHVGIRAALKAVLPGVKWQRCQVHLQRNAFAYVPKADMKEAVARDIRNIFNAPELKDAERMLNETVEKYRKTASRLAAWIEENIPEGFTVFSIPDKHRKRLRTTNMLERLNKEIKRKTGVATLFPNENSLLRLVSAILIEISEEWETDSKAYLTICTD